MRPIIWGIILAIVGAIGWVVSVILAVLTLGAFKIFTYIFGILFIASLPIAGLVELVRYLRKRKKV